MLQRFPFVFFVSFVVSSPPIQNQSRDLDCYRLAVTHSFRSAPLRPCVLPLWSRAMFSIEPRSGVD